MAQSLFDEMGLESVLHTMRDATRRAIAEAHAHGLPVTLGKPDGSIIQLFPDGHEEVVKPAPATVSPKAVNA